MVDELNPNGKRKFIIWIIGAGLLCVLVGLSKLDDSVFRDCFIALSGFVTAANAVEHWVKK